MTNAIVAEGLVKHYGEVIALDGLDLEVAEGTVLGLLGPNGAGKTTCVRILSTQLQPDSGHATVAGHDVLRDAKALRRVIGLSGQNAAVDEHLTGFENLDMVGRLYHLGKRRRRRRAHELIERFDLTDAADRTVKGYSGGMRRRLDLAAALVAEPPVLFLDEPTTGLDPRSRMGMWEVIADLVRGGTTLLLTTQYLEEADRLADRSRRDGPGGGPACPRRRRCRPAGRWPAPPHPGRRLPDPHRSCRGGTRGGGRRGREHRDDDDEGRCGMSSLLEAVGDTAVITKRNLIKIKRVPDLLVFTTLSPIMFVLLFAYVFGSAIDVPGVGYKEFLIAGIFAQTVVFGSTFTGYSLAEDLQKGVIDRFRSLPMAPSAVLFGRTLSDVLNNVISLVVMALTGLVVGWRIRSSVLEALAGFALVLLFAYAISWVMAWVGLVVRTPEIVNNASFIVIFPITFIANTFVPTNDLPGPLKAFANWNPVSSVTQGARDLFGNISPSLPTGDSWSLQHPVVYTLVWVVLILAIFVPLSVRQYKRAASR